MHAPLCAPSCVPESIHCPPAPHDAPARGTLQQTGGPGAGESRGAPGCCRLAGDVQRMSGVSSVRPPQQPLERAPYSFRRPHWLLNSCGVSSCWRSSTGSSRSQACQRWGGGGVGGGRGVQWALAPVRALPRALLCSRAPVFTSHDFQPSYDAAGASTHLGGELGQRDGLVRRHHQRRECGIHLEGRQDMAGPRQRYEASHGSVRRQRQASSAWRWAGGWGAERQAAAAGLHPPTAGRRSEGSIQADTRTILSTSGMREWSRLRPEGADRQGGTQHERRLSGVMAKRARKCNGGARRCSRRCDWHGPAGTTTLPATLRQRRTRRPAEPLPSRPLSALWVGAAPWPGAKAAAAGTRTPRPAAVAHGCWPLLRLPGPEAAADCWRGAVQYRRTVSADTEGWPRRVAAGSGESQVGCGLGRTTRSALVTVSASVSASARPVSAWLQAAAGLGGKGWARVPTTNPAAQRPRAIACDNHDGWKGDRLPRACAVAASSPAAWHRSRRASDRPLAIAQLLTRASHDPESRWQCRQTDEAADGPAFAAQPWLARCCRVCDAAAMHYREVL